MAEARSIDVKLTADVSEYVDQMARATAATKELEQTLRACGITAADMPTAIRGALKFTRGDAERIAG